MAKTSRPQVQIYVQILSLILWQKQILVEITIRASIIILEEISACRRKRPRSSKRDIQS